MRNNNASLIVSQERFNSIIEKWEKTWLKDLLVLDSVGNYRLDMKKAQDAINGFIHEKRK